MEQLEPKARILAHLTFLYGAERAAATLPALEQAVARTRERLAAQAGAEPGATAPLGGAGPLDERDALLIAYGDSVRSPGEPPLRTLHRFLADQMGDMVSGVHILPFYPWTSDDGFSVVDYRAIDPALGSWEDVEAIGRTQRVMFDAVINHISQASNWFQAYLRSEEPYAGYFVEADPAQDLSAVVRPRTLPLLTPVETARGTRHVWTTFSADQIDLNYANPQLLVEIAELLLFYAERGAGLIRLDAIAYMWKEPGTRSIHMPQAHAVIKLLRAVLDAAAPHVLLITETNVPHADNISYFGAPLPAAPAEPAAPGAQPRSDEAQLVYQFPLAPLLLHTLAQGDAGVLTEWAAGLGNTPGAFFNFTASHDGIGVLPALGLLTPDEVGALAERTRRHGGLISYRALPDGSQTAYELNITFYDALNNPATPNLETDVARFLASQAIMLALAGMPGIYFQSLLGARNCHSCFDSTGRARSLNREKFDYDTLRLELADPGSRAHLVFEGYRRLLRARRRHPAFHPAAPQTVLKMGAGLFALLRQPLDGPGRVLCLTNVTEREQTVDLDQVGAGGWSDLLSGRACSGATTLAPYQVLWLAESAAT